MPNHYNTPFAVLLFICYFRLSLAASFTCHMLATCLHFLKMERTWRMIKTICPLTYSTCSTPVTWPSTRVIVVKVYSCGSFKCHMISVQVPSMTCRTSTRMIAVLLYAMHSSHSQLYCYMPCPVSTHICIAICLVSSHSQLYCYMPCTVHSQLYCYMPYPVSTHSCVAICLAQFPLTNTVPME